MFKILGAKNRRKNLHKHPGPPFQIRGGPGSFSNADNSHIWLLKKDKKMLIRWLVYEKFISWTYLIILSAWNKDEIWFQRLASFCKTQTSLNDWVIIYFFLFFHPLQMKCKRWINSCWNQLHHFLSIRFAGFISISVLRGALVRVWFCSAQCCI